MSFLESYREVFQQMLRWVLENLGQPFLVHCTAGKDRTAVAVALLLSIAGVPKESIAHEYAVTRIGIEPVRELLEGKLMGTGGQRMDWTDQRLVAIAQCQYADDAL